MSLVKRFSVALLSVGALALLAGTLTASSAKTVTMRDDCDPTTFNAPPPNGAGPGTCVGDGHTTFAEFIQELMAHQRADKWRFNPDRFDTERAVVARNRGGESHTFTHVKAFGGGFVPPLNQLSGNPVEAPECADPTVFATLVTPGHETGEIHLKPGTYKFQCCIHPWMRATIEVKGDDNDHDR